MPIRSALGEHRHIKRDVNVTGVEFASNGKRRDQCHHALNPASTVITDPVMNCAAGLARNVTAAAMSAGLP